MTERPSPTVRRRGLATRLRQLREQAKLTQEEAAAECGWSRGKVRFLEISRSRRPSPRDVADLLDLYARRGAKISETTRAEIVQLAKDARIRGWWYGYGNVLPEHYQTYIGLEAEAQTVLTVQPLIVPGLLQTEGYARAISTYGSGDDCPSSTSRRVEVRLKRQHVLTRAPEPLRLVAVLGEAVIRQQARGGVMREQLQHLLNAVQTARVTIQIVPFAPDPWPGMEGSFSILQFSDEYDDVVYVEAAGGEYFAETPGELRRYHTRHQRCMAAGLSPTGSLEMIQQAIGQR